jgi:excinuclease ABC subunit A
VRHAEPAPESETKPLRRAVKSAAKSPAKPAPESPLTEALKARLIELRAAGFNRLYQQGAIFEFSTPESLLDLDFTLPVFVLLDRIVVSAENRARIVDAAEIAYRESSEVIFEELPRDESAPRRRHRFSANYECKSCHRPGREPEPRLFSFNNPFGACPRCQGFGNTIDFDPNLVIPDKALTLAAGAIDPWNRPKYRPWSTEMIRKQAVELGIPLDVPWYDLPEQPLL